ncbi:hypothetical protein RHEC894_CH02133 [Rhizobium sp. CIAT894]|uniref:hypothetical protein n=1 Tax=Rhizobium sp. CIAT894 TaxID=2020312 RepID=UPI000A20ACD3|nr:hypothetical protein [Rhizobium sp. CIAT894]ARM88433.1 hypothetical protein RHEC894_CH02133 [Rhizobium sp. CIAT894]
MRIEIQSRGKVEWRISQHSSAPPNIKDPLFDTIMDGADEWATLIGWWEPPAD